VSLLNHSELALAFLFACSVKATLLLLFAWTVTAALRGQSAALRHQVWAAGILGALAVPAFTLLLPAWHSSALKQASALWTAQHASAPHDNFANLPSMLVEAVTASPAVHTFKNLLFLVWALGFLLFTIRLLSGLMQLRRISAGAKSVERNDWVSRVSPFALACPAIPRRGAHAHNVGSIQAADPPSQGR
jgi:hypothetical protein